MHANLYKQEGRLKPALLVKISARSLFHIHDRGSDVGRPVIVNSLAEVRPAADEAGERKIHWHGAIGAVPTGPGTVMLPAFVEVELPRKQREVCARSVGVKPMHVHRVGAARVDW